jgi:hypothetical protein
MSPPKKKKKSRNFKIHLRARPKKSAFQNGQWAELNAQKEWYLKNGVFIDENIKKMAELRPKRGLVFIQH